jgi:hypothetical protein
VEKGADCENDARNREERGDAQRKLGNRTPPAPPLGEAVEPWPAKHRLVGLGENLRDSEHGTPPSLVVLEKAFRAYEIEMEMSPAV